MSRPGVGIVYIVGAGPGDPGLLTRRGAEVLRRAELVVCDGLVDPRVLGFAPAGVRVVFVGRRGEGRTVGQEAVNRLLLEAAQAGQVVVRLKGGDPYVFGRGAEEAAALDAARVPFEVIPGVSAFASVPALAGVALLPSGGPPVLSVVSGHEDPTKPTAQVHWPAVAALPGLKLVLMGMERIGGIADGLMAGGMPGSTPVLLVRWGSTPAQEALEGTLADVGERVLQADFRAPAVMVIGEAGLANRRSLGWFESRPLFGRRVVVTRAREQAAGMVKLLVEQGAEVIDAPMLRFEAPEDPDPADQALGRLGEYDWVVFTSVNGVDAFFARLLASEPDIRVLGQARLAAVGEATAARLRGLRLRVDVVPEQFVGRNIAAAIARKEDLRDLRVLVARAESGAPGVLEELESGGAMVDDVAFYRTVAETDDPGGGLARFLAEGADWLTFTSGSAVTNLQERVSLPELLERHPRMRVASLGPETSRVLAGLGVTPAVEARPHTVEGLVAAMADAG